jgi:DNA polymerase elongation subunit (family B)
MAEPKVLVWDIETSHNVAAIFKLFEDYTSHENILQERYIICASWKWLDEKKVHSVSVLDDPKLYKRDQFNDLHVVHKLYDILCEADVIVAHNGDAYDLKFAEGRMLAHGLKPLPPMNSIDTLKIAKSKFLLNSNKLDYLARYLGFGKKLHTSNELWLRILKGDKKAIAEMVEYNKHDVILLEKVFLKLRPYCSNYVNRQLFGLDGCPFCGSQHTTRQGVRRALTRVYPRFQCQDCGGWYKGNTPVGKSTSTRIL